MKKTHTTIKSYDYSSWDELKKDIPKMEKKGYRLMEKRAIFIDEIFCPHEITDLEGNIKCISASFIKSDMM